MTSTKIALSAFLVAALVGILGLAFGQNGAMAVAFVLTLLGMALLYAGRGK